MYSEAKWKDNKLFVRNVDTGISIGPDQEYPKLYRIGWDNWISPDFYNKTRAVDNAMRIYQQYMNGIAEVDLEKGSTDV